MKKVILSTVVVAAALISSCNTPQGMVVEGNASSFDSLSYALGNNIGSSIKHQMSDMPFDFNKMGDGLKAAAFNKSTITQEEAIVEIQDYFNNVRPQRTQIVEENRNREDSIAYANGADSAAVIAARAALKADADMFESEAQRSEISYAIGVDLGTNIVNAEIPLHIYWVNKAIADAVSGNTTMSAEESMAYVQNYFTVVRPAEMLALSVEKLAEVEKKSGVVKTESGLLYRIEQAGDESLIATDDRDTVEVNYTGRLLRNDKVFDTSRFADRAPEQQEMIKMQNPDSYGENTPIKFPLNRVIPGWTEGMKYVGKGGRISLWIPAELAYGAAGAGRDIGPNDALYFDVEIVDVLPYSTEE